jgi:hypothetical protein
MTNKKMPAAVLSAMLFAVLCCGLIFTTCGKLEKDVNVYTITFIAEYTQRVEKTEKQIIKYVGKDGVQVDKTEDRTYWVNVYIDAFTGQPVNVSGVDGKREGMDDLPVLNPRADVTRRTDGDGKLTKFPPDPERPDYSFAGWFTQGGTRVTKNTIFTTHTRVHAEWKAGEGVEAVEVGDIAKEFAGIREALEKGQPLSTEKPDEVTVTVKATESLIPITLESKGERKVRIILDGGVIDPDTKKPLYFLTISESGSLFSVGGNVRYTYDPIRKEEVAAVIGSVTLELRNVRMEGNDRNTRALLTVNDGGKLIIGENALDKTYISLNGSENEKSGGGVTVNKGGELVMNGGDIYQCTVHARPYDDPEGWPGGGGVLVRGGTFTMAGGNIERCFGSINGGGVLVDKGGRFTMTGGQIYDNSAPYGGGVSTYRGGLFVMDGTNATVKENLAREGGGIFVDAGAEHALPYDPRRKINFPGMTWEEGGNAYYNPDKPDNDPRKKEGFYLVRGSVEDNHSLYDGGGVYNFQGGIVYMTGGTIRGNIADDFGGGVQNMGLFIMITGNIEGNRARYGGGVLAGLNMFAMEGGNIRTNRATGAGGGVFALQGSFFQMGGTIGGTTQYQQGGNGNYADGFGGGVAVYPEGNFAMAGGAIGVNTCGSNYNSTDGMVSFFDSTDPKLLGLAWYGKRPEDVVEERVIPGDPHVVAYCKEDFKNPDGVDEVLLLSYLVPYVRNNTTGLVTYLGTVGYSANFTNNVNTISSGGYISTPRIEVRDGKLYYGPSPGVKPLWATWE